MSDSQPPVSQESTSEEPHVIKLTVFVHEETLAKLDALATLEDTTVTEMINQALGFYIYCKNERSKGRKILIKGRLRTRILSNF